MRRYRYAASVCDSDASLRAPKYSISTSRIPKCCVCAVLMQCVRDWRLRQRCVATRTNDYDSNASLRMLKMFCCFYFCYADGAVATAMRRYIHVNVLFLLHTPQSVACLSHSYTYDIRLMSAQTGQLQPSTAMRPYADGARSGYDGDASLRATYA